MTCERAEAIVVGKADRLVDIELVMVENGGMKPHECQPPWTVHSIVCLASHASHGLIQ